MDGARGCVRFATAAAALSPAASADLPIALPIRCSQLIREERHSEGSLQSPGSAPRATRLHGPFVNMGRFQGWASLTAVPAVFKVT